MNITGETMIFRNQGKGYSTSLSNKKEDGSYENMGISINFRKGVELENKTKINILDGFLSFYKNKDGILKPKIVVLEFEEINNANDDLPF